MALPAGITATDHSYSDESGYHSYATYTDAQGNPVQYVPPMYQTDENGQAQGPGTQEQWLTGNADSGFAGYLSLDEQAQKQAFDAKWGGAVNPTDASFLPQLEGILQQQLGGQYSADQISQAMQSSSWWGKLGSGSNPYNAAWEVAQKLGADTGGFNQGTSEQYRQAAEAASPEARQNAASKANDDTWALPGFIAQAAGIASLGGASFGDLLGSGSAAIAPSLVEEGLAAATTPSLSFSSVLQSAGASMAKNAAGQLIMTGDVDWKKAGIAGLAGGAASMAPTINTGFSAPVNAGILGGAVSAITGGNVLEGAALGAGSNMLNSALVDNVGLSRDTASAITAGARTLASGGSFANALVSGGVDYAGNAIGHAWNGTEDSNDPIVDDGKLRTGGIVGSLVSTALMPKAGSSATGSPAGSPAAGPTPTGTPPPPKSIATNSKDLSYGNVALSYKPASWAPTSSYA